ncbi:MAG: M28 family metallopeptidase [Promethearchaeota archaeon]
MKVEISEEDDNYMYNIIQKIIDEAGCRMPCSPQEAKGAEIIKEELEKTCDEVVIEPFTCHPRAFLGWIRIDVTLVALSILIFVFLPYLPKNLWIFLVLTSFCLNILAFIIIWNEFFNYKEFIDPLFKKRPSQNVVGVIKAKKEKEHIYIFSGHHDSALQFNLLRYFKGGYGIILFLAMGILFFWILVSIFIVLLAVWAIITSLAVNYDWFSGLALNLLMIGLIPLVALWFFVSSGEKANKVPGAVDNLSAVAVVLGLGRYLKKNRDIIPDNAEIRLISFGCEEAGLRGAYRYAEAHLEELKKYNAIVVNMDGIQSAKKPLIIEFEPTTRTQHSAVVVKKLIEAAKTVDLNVKAFGSRPIEKFIGQISGGTDATAFSKAGIKAASIASMELKKFIKFYHQPTDTLDMIDRGALEKVLKICIGFIMNEKNIKLKTKAKE